MDLSGPWLPVRKVVKLLEVVVSPTLVTGLPDEGSVVRRKVLKLDRPLCKLLFERKGLV